MHDALESAIDTPYYSIVDGPGQPVRLPPKRRLGCDISNSNSDCAALPSTHARTQGSCVPPATSHLTTHAGARLVHTHLPKSSAGRTQGSVAALPWSTCHDTHVATERLVDIPSDQLIAAAVTTYTTAARNLLPRHLSEALLNPRPLLLLQTAPTRLQLQPEALRAAGNGAAGGLQEVVTEGDDQE